MERGELPFSFWRCFRLSFIPGFALLRLCRLSEPLPNVTDSIVAPTEVFEVSVPVAIAVQGGP